MNNETSTDGCDDSDDPLQVNQVIDEVYEEVYVEVYEVSDNDPQTDSDVTVEASDNDAQTENEEANTVEALSRSFEPYVQNHQETCQQAWEESSVAYDPDRHECQDTLAALQARLQRPKAKP